MPRIAVRRSSIRSPTAAQRVWVFIGGIGLAAGVLTLTVVIGLPPASAPFIVPWPLAAIAFYLGEVNVVEVRFLRERHSFSLSELPAIVGLFFLDPTDYMLAMLIGTTLALLSDRQSTWMKRCFNVAQFALVGAVALTVFHLLATPTGALPGPREWFAAIAAAAVTSVLGAILVATVISLSGGAPQFTKLPEMLRFSGMVALANASLALLATMVLWVDPRSAFLLGVPIAIVFVAYRAYVGEREKHERLELLYESSRLLHHTPEVDAAIVALVEHSRRMFRAETVTLVLLVDPASSAAVRSSSGESGATEAMVEVEIPVDDPIRQRITTAREAFRAAPGTGWTPEPERAHEVVVGPLVGERGVLGAIVIVNRLGEGTHFTDDDLRLLETVANQAAVALENGRLERSLHELSTLKEALRHQAYHDSLTGLANRLAFVEALELRLASAVAARPDAIVFLDLDDFKIVNDSLGHGAGDELLTAVADRLRERLRSEDLLARFGGDEFAILPSVDATPEDVLVLAQRIVTDLGLPFPVAGTDVVVGCSVGIAYAHPGVGVDELLRDADVAMYRAKADGKRRVEVFDPRMHRSIVERHSLTSDLARGVTRGELEVHYQPIVALATGRIVALEALARWTHPTRGEVDPDEFIRLAEESGAIHTLGRQVLHTATARIAAWQSHPGLGTLGLSVNLSPVQIGDPRLIEDVTAVLDASGLRPTDLTFEMTETAMFRDTARTIERLDVLRSMGIRIAMDDFGTGYSSLAYLRRFPVDSLKIARELIGDPTDPDPGGWEFARAIIALGRSLGLPIVAEGIESEEQLATLRRMGCGLGQGYLLGRPADAATIEALLLGTSARLSA